jgi:hypothetical protein
MTTLGHFRPEGDWHYVWPHGHLQPPFNVLEIGAAQDPDGIPFVFDSNNMRTFSGYDLITGQDLAKNVNNEVRSYQQYRDGCEPGTGTWTGPFPSIYGGTTSELGTGLPMFPIQFHQNGSGRRLQFWPPDRPAPPNVRWTQEGRIGTSFAEDGVDWWHYDRVSGGVGVLPEEDGGWGGTLEPNMYGYPAWMAINANSSMWAGMSSWGTMWWQRDRVQPIHIEPGFMNFVDGSGYGNNLFNTWNRHVFERRMWNVDGYNVTAGAHDYFSLGYSAVGHRPPGKQNENGMNTPFRAINPNSTSSLIYTYTPFQPWSEYGGWTWDQFNTGEGLQFTTTIYGKRDVDGGFIGGEWVQLGWKAAYPSWNGSYDAYDWVTGGEIPGRSKLTYPAAASGMMCHKGVTTSNQALNPLGVGKTDIYDNYPSDVFNYSSYPGCNPDVNMYETSGLMGIVEGCVTHKRMDRTYLEIYFFGKHCNEIVDQGELWFYHPTYGTPQTFTTQCGGRLQTQFLGEGDFPGFYHKSRKLLYDAYGDDTGFDPPGAHSLNSVDFEHPGFVYWRYDSAREIGGYAIRRHTPKIGFPKGQDRIGVQPGIMEEEHGWLWHNQWTPYPENLVSPLYYREIMVGVRANLETFLGAPDTVSGGFYDRY